MNPEIILGLAGVLGVWVTAGLALPFVNRLTALTPEQLMLSRGVLTAIPVAILLQGQVWQGIDQWALLLGGCFALAALGLYRGIRAWGASRTITVVTLTPVMNFMIAWGSGQTVPLAVIFSLGMILVGVAIALRSPFALSRAGLAWSLFGVVMNGFFYEFAGNTTSPALVACFWQAVLVATIGGLGSLQTKWDWVRAGSRLRWAVGGFALVGGLLYFLANLLAFAHLPKVVAAVLVQGETPAVILMARVLLQERLTMMQWAGVILALLGAAYLSYAQVS